MLVFGYPNSYYPQASPRERYLRALAEEEAARQAYVDDISGQYYPTSYAGYYGNDYELREARARGLYRQRQHQQQRARAIELERERERRRQLYEAELEKRRLIETMRRREQQQRQTAEYFNHLRPMFSEREPKREQEEPTQTQTPHVEAASPPIPSTSVQIPIANSPPTRPGPSHEEQEAAATLIQRHFRTHLLRTKAQTILSTIRSQLTSLTSSFTFPSFPSFDTSVNTTPRLLYNTTNAPIHAFEDQLIKLFSKLDEVESGGDKQIRAARKALARDIEMILEDVDRKEEAAWKEWIKLSEASVATVGVEDVPMTNSEESTLGEDSRLSNEPGLSTESDLPMSTAVDEPPSQPSPSPCSLARAIPLPEDEDASMESAADRTPSINTTAAPSVQIHTSRSSSPDTTFLSQPFPSPTVAQSILSPPVLNDMDMEEDEEAVEGIVHIDAETEGDDEEFEMI